VVRAWIPAGAWVEFVALAGRLKPVPFPLIATARHLRPL
jgi:hypothetical protein